MKIDKLPSGSYRIRKMVDGKSKSFTFDHKPTQKEIAAVVAENATVHITQQNAPKHTFDDCAKKYIEVKKNVLSASTVRSYNGVLNSMDEEFKRTKLCDMDQLTIQQYINDLSAKRSPKTVKNHHSFISAVIKMFVPGIVLNTTLPKVQKNDVYIPTSEDVKAVLRASNDKYYIPFMLGAYGLRRSEILALKWPSDFDIENNLVLINKSMVQTEDNSWIVQNYNKTVESRRSVPVSPELIDRISNQGYVFNGYPDKILEYLYTKQKQLGLPRFKFHSLRHYFATELDQAGFSSKDVQKLGGWSSDSILRTVYQHNRVDRDKEIQQRAAALIENNLK